MEKKPVIILGIESSCDDTSAAVLRDGVLLSNERVIWENPDEIGKDTFRTGDGATTKGGL